MCVRVCMSVCLLYAFNVIYNFWTPRCVFKFSSSDVSSYITQCSLRTAPCHTPHTPYSAVVTHAQRQFRFQFRMLSMRRGSNKKKRTRRNATQKKNKQKLLAKFKQHFVVGPAQYVASLGPPCPLTPDLPPPLSS